MTREQLLASAFLELADTLGDTFDVLDFLQRLVERSVHLSQTAAGGLILLDHRDEPQLVTSSTHDARVLELFSIAIAEGPCVEVARTGTPLVNIDHEVANERWPRFTAAARELGYEHAHVVPMRNRTHVLGALSLFDSSSEGIDADDLAIVQALAGVATIGLLHERAPRRRELLASALQEALAQRVVMEQAKGVVAELAGISPGEAFVLISSYSQARSVPLSVLGTHVLERSSHLEALLAGAHA